MRLLIVKLTSILTRLTLRYHGLVTVCRNPGKPHYTDALAPTSFNAAKIPFKPTAYQCKSDIRIRGVAAPPPYRNPFTEDVARNFRAIRAAGDMLSIFMGKTRFKPGLLYEAIYSLNENIIRHTRKLLYRYHEWKAKNRRKNSRRSTHY